MQNILTIAAQLVATVVLLITLTCFAPAMDQVVSHLTTVLSAAQVVDRQQR